jgi:DNA-binding NarL/FixJ family response regulator
VGVAVASKDGAALATVAVKPSGIRILLAESIPLVQEGIRSVLERQGGHTVVAVVSTVAKGQQVLLREHVDVVIACVELEDQSGVVLLNAARKAQPHVRMLLLSEAESERELYMAFKVGASGYFSKLIPAERLLSVVKEVCEGQVLVSTDALHVSRRTRDTIDQEMRQIDSPAPPEEYLPLSHRELEVLKLIAQGNGNKTIAQNLGISDQTVKNHITAILRKLGVNDRTHAAIYALQRGWIEGVQT